MITGKFRVQLIFSQALIQCIALFGINSYEQRGRTKMSSAKLALNEMSCHNRDRNSRPTTKSGGCIVGVGKVIVLGVSVG